MGRQGELTSHRPPRQALGPLPSFSRFVLDTQTDSSYCCSNPKPQPLVAMFTVRNYSFPGSSKASSERFDGCTAPSPGQEAVRCASVQQLANGRQFSCCRTKERREGRREGGKDQVWAGPKGHLSTLFKPAKVFRAGHAPPSASPPGMAPGHFPGTMWQPSWGWRAGQ